MPLISLRSPVVPTDFLPSPLAGLVRLARHSRPFRRRATLLAVGVFSTGVALAALSEGPVRSAGASDALPVQPLTTLTPPTYPLPEYNADLFPTQNTAAFPAGDLGATDLPAQLASDTNASPEPRAEDLDRSTSDIPSTLPPGPITKASPAIKTVWMEVTAYCACTQCCGEGAQGLTASGRPISYNRGRFVAADTSLLPFGTKLSIPGYHNAKPVEVIDRGGAIKGLKLDVYFDSHQTARKWGRRWLPVTIK